MKLGFQSEEEGENPETTFDQKLNSFFRQVVLSFCVIIMEHTTCPVLSLLNPLGQDLCFIKGICGVILILLVLLSIINPVWIHVGIFSPVITATISYCFWLNLQVLLYFFNSIQSHVLVL